MAASKKTVKNIESLIPVDIDIMLERIIPFDTELAQTGSGYSIKLVTTANRGNERLEKRVFQISYTAKGSKLVDFQIPTLLVKKPLGTGPELKKRKKI